VEGRVLWQPPQLEAGPHHQPQLTSPDTLATRTSLGSVVPPISLRSSTVKTSCPCSAWSPQTQHCRRPCSSCHSLRCRGVIFSFLTLCFLRRVSALISKRKKTRSQASCSFCAQCS